VFHKVKCVPDITVCCLLPKHGFFRIVILLYVLDVYLPFRGLSFDFRISVQVSTNISVDLFNFCFFISISNLKTKSIILNQNFESIIYVTKDNYVNMGKETSDQKNIIFDRIIVERRSHRQFRQEFPPKDDIKGIIHAGLHAPFAAAAVSNAKDYFRRFFVLKMDSKNMKTAASLIFEEVSTIAFKLELAMENDPQLHAQARGFANRLATIKKMETVPGVGTAPYFIIVVEKKGFPAVEQQSLAHCLENMWLKATALGLGFQLVSATAQMAENPSFCAMLGINPGEWALNGCAIGYPTEELSSSIRPSVDEVIRWLE
jgi:nitroreductase